MLDIETAVSPRVALRAFKSKVIEGDVVSVLKKQPVRIKYDVIIADPPYNIGKDFGVTDDNMPLGEYLEWTNEWLYRCFELLADNGIIYVYGFPEILARVAANYPIEDQRWLVWHYTNKTVPSARFWQRSHESILCLWKPEYSRPTLEINQIREPYTEGYKKCIGKIRKGTDSRFNRGRGHETIYRDYGGALPRDVLKIPALAGGAGASERWFMCHDCNNKVYPPSKLKHHRDHDIMKHPTQKPMDLTDRLIKSKLEVDQSNAGRVLIPFAGSGSECVVANRLGVEWLGIEINPEYVDFSRKWIKQCTN